MQNDTFIQANHRNGLRTTLQALVNRFERKPYGWYLAAIQCTLAWLCARGKVELRRDGNLLEDQALEHALRNTHGFDNVVLDPQIDFTAAQVRRLKKFYANFFDGPPHANEAKAPWLFSSPKGSFNALSTCTATSPIPSPWC